MRILQIDIASYDQMKARNQELLALIVCEHPSPLTELARLAGREKSNLSHTVKTLARYGLVELETGSARQVSPADAL